MKRKEFKKREDPTIDPKEFESYNYGPLKLERIGRFVRMSSNWDQDKYENYIQNIKTKRPEIKEEINEKIKDILLILEQFDPLELLASISIQNLFTDPEKYKEVTYEGKECYVEYALSLSLGCNKPSLGTHATEEAIEKFKSLITEIYNDVLWHFGTEFVEEKINQAHSELRFNSINRFLFLRGDSYREHHIELIRTLFKDHDLFLKKNFGFTIDEIILCLENIELQLNENINFHSNFAKKVKELHEIYKHFLDQEGIDSFSSLEECKEKYHSLPEVKQLYKELNILEDKVIENPFILKPNANVTEELLKLLSAKFGENEIFSSFKVAPSWPTNDSMIYEKPLINYNGKYFCFAPQILIRNIGNILESWIKRKNESYFNNNYKNKRAKFLEKKGLEYFKVILPSGQFFEKLYYNIVEKDETKRAETDGIILYDNNLFIIEAKSGSLSTSARRGGLEGIKKDTKKLIEDAYSQALRTKNFIISTDIPRFEYENGSEALVIEDKNKFDNIYIINTTAENLGHLSTQLNSLKTLNLIQGKEWPWSIFINDLRVISELIEFPTEFLLFLQRRIRANDYSQFDSFDELDFLMFFFYEGLYFEDGILEKTDVFIPHAYTEDLDRYYDYIGGRVSSGNKPQLKTSELYKNLINKIESIRKEKFTKVTTTLLGFDSETQEEILNFINFSRTDRMDHDFTLLFNQINLGLTISINSNHKPDFHKRIDYYCRIKMYQTRLEEWILITLDEKENIDFTIYNKLWEQDSEMEVGIKKYKDWKWAELKSQQIKVGRNMSMWQWFKV